MGQSFEQPAPVALFVYNRPAHTQRTLDALAANEGAAQTVLHIYADGPKPWRTPDDRRAIEAVRELIRGENRFAAVKLHERDTNHGLAQSIIAGVSERTQTDGAVIVLEDDIVTGPYFLTFMNQALAQYQAKPEVMHIAAYTPPVQSALPDTFFSKIMFCWGWATWADAWQHFDRSAVSLLRQIYQSGRRSEFNLEDTYNWFGQLERIATGQLNAWAACWYASIFVQQGLCLQPGRSLIHNIGHDGSGVNCLPQHALQDLPIDHLPALSTLPLQEDKQARGALRSHYSQLGQQSSGLATKLKHSIKQLLPARIKTALREEWQRRQNAQQRAEERELARLRSLPRYIPGQTTLLGTPLSFLDQASLRFMYEELFQRGLYNFSAHRDQPYILDLGANIGLSLIAFKQQHPKAVIDAFEPDPTVYQVLAENVARFQLSDIQLHNAAVWREQAELKFRCEGADAGGILKNGPSNEAAIEVPAVPIREWLQQPVDMLKMDIEGAETEVLRAAGERLQNVAQMYIEYHSTPDQPQQLSAILQTLEANGHRYWISNGGVELAQPLKGYPPKQPHDALLHIFTLNTQQLDPANN